MTTKTKRNVIDITSWIWAIIAFLVWIQGYDLTKLGLSETVIELIQFGAAGLVIILQALKPKEDNEEVIEQETNL